MTAPACRSCGTPLTRTLVDLGKTPLANSYVPPQDAATPDEYYPLHARVCETCFLVQVDDVVPPEAIFRDYAYFSSFSAGWVEHARKYAEQAISKFDLGPDDLIAEVASNDGYLLQHFVKAGLPVLGIDPALDAAEAARERGVRTETEFFGHDNATKLRGTYGAASVIAANNVLAHVPDINDFVSGFSALMAEEGVASFEFPHILNLLEKVQFDTIYHEHFSYLSLHAVEKCFARHGLRVFNVEELPTHGGSLRVWACHSASSRQAESGLEAIRKKESDFGIATTQAYDGFPAKVDAIKTGLLAFLTKAKSDGKTVAGYGAAAKGNTLLNYSGVTTDDISFVVDANPMKQNTLLPGSRIPVHGPDALSERKPDYVLILPWNIAEEVATSMSHISDWGGRFAVAVPQLTILP